MDMMEEKGIHRKNDGGISGKQQPPMDYMPIIPSYGRLRQDYKLETSLAYMLSSKPPAWKE